MKTQSSGWHNYKIDNSVSTIMCLAASYGFKSNVNCRRCGKAKENCIIYNPFILIAYVPTFKKCFKDKPHPLITITNCTHINWNCIIMKWCCFVACIVSTCSFKTAFFKLNFSYTLRSAINVHAQHWPYT